MPGTLVRPNLQTLPGWIQAANIADDAITIPKFADLADQGILGRGADGAGPVELLLASADGRILKRSGGVIGFSALDATDWAPQLAADSTWTGNQSFEDGVILVPTTDPVAPASGQLWVRTSDGALMYKEPGGATIPIRQTGTFTPSLIPDTVGNFAVTYSSQLGGYTKFGRWVFAWINIVTTSITWTTASGTMRIHGLPFAAATSVAQSGASVLHTLFGLSLATTAGIMEPKLAASGGGNTSAVFRQTVRGAPTTTGNLALGGTSGFISGTNVTIQGGFWYMTNEA